MEWTCTSCGSSAVVSKARLLVAMGWKVTGKRECVCAPCVKRLRLDQEPVVRAAHQMREGAARVREEARDQVVRTRAQQGGGGKS